MRGRAVLTLVLLVWALLPPGAVLARSAPAAGLGAAHERLVERPADRDRLYAYARAAIREGNFEAAVSALEGLLVVSRNQPRALLELGALYRRMGAPRVAEAYLRRARELAGEGTEIASFANAYLHEAERETSRSRWSGFARFGLRYQSNPTLSPESDEILSQGFIVQTPNERDEQGDTNAVLYSRIGHRYVLAPRTSLDSDLILYGTLYDKNSQLNYGVLELASGVRYAGPANARGRYSLRPHLVLRGSVFDGSLYEKTAGLGLDVSLRAGSSTVFNGTYQFRHQDFADYDGRGTSSQRSGDEQRLDLRLVGEIARGQVLSLRLFGRHRGAERDYYELDQYDITLRYSLKLPNVVFQGRPLMTLSPYVIRRISEYGASDPGIDPTRTRTDREWRLGLDYRVPFAPTWAMMLNLEYAKVDSSIVNYDSRNNLVMLGLEKRF